MRKFSLMMIAALCAGWALQGFAQHSVTILRFAASSMTPAMSVQWYSQRRIILMYPEV